MKPCADSWRMYLSLCRAPCEPVWHRIACSIPAGVRTPKAVLSGIAVGLLVLAVQTGIAKAQPEEIADPTTGFARVFGLGGHACKQYDDTGRLYIYSEGIPSTEVMSWLQRSDGGTKANVPMPEKLETALPLIPGCLPGKHHAAVRTG